MRRALVCAPLLPEFDREAGSRRIFDLVTILRDEGWAVSFFAQGSTPEQERYGRALRRLGVSVYVGSHSTGVGDEFIWEPSRLFASGRFDLAILAFWHLAERYITPLRHYSPQTRLIVDTIDLHFLRNARGILTGGPGQQHLLDVRFGREIAGELRTYASADALLTVSAKEAELIDTLLNGSVSAYVVPLMEEMVVSELPFDRRRGILFLGSFRHPPNRDAARVLCEQILPRVEPSLLADHPVYVVGNGLDEEISHLCAALPTVRTVGWVPSVEPYLHRCRISVLPLRHGAGTKQKLIQALMAGTPSVSTSIGIEGLGLQHEEQVLVADTPDDFAGAIERLLTDERLWRAMAGAGRRHIAARHSRAAVRAAFLTAVERVMDSAADGGSPAHDAMLAVGDRRTKELK